MKFLYSLAGANVPVIKEFEIENDAKVNEGDLVYFDINGKVTANTGGIVLGVSAETHTGVKDLLNERNDKDRIRVDVTQGGVYEMSPVTVVATNDGTATTFICSDEGLNTTVMNAKLVLVEKAEGSTNTDNIGAVRTVASSACADGVCTMKLNEGGISCAGDVYELYPAPGTVGALSENGKDFAVSSPVPISLAVVGRDLARQKLEVKFRSTVFNY